MKQDYSICEWFKIDCVVYMTAVIVCSEKLIIAVIIGHTDRLVVFF